ncbi:MAG TPA: chloride channel protein [Vicinamibacterales bacterium]|nr:chloride channel protein [Vicinamibacterales bacterium]
MKMRPHWPARWLLGPGEWRLRDSQLFLALTIVIGVLAGLSAVLFALSIDAAGYFFFGLAPGPARVILVPTLVSLLSGILLATWFNDARGSGVPQTKTAYHLRQGVIRPRVPIGKFITGVLCIGSGHSMGREGPSVQIGAGLASAVGQWLKLPPDRVKSLVPVGASAALAAAFNTPVAAVLFALEEIIADLNAPLLGSTVIASVAAVIVARSLLGNDPLFHVPEYELQHPLELLAYVVLGIVGGLASVAFGKGLLRARGYFLGLPAWSRTWQPAVGGLAIGLILVVFPEVAGVGYTHIDQALNGGLVLSAMVVLAVVKGGATIVSYSTGNAGGIFAPSLFLGAMVGGAVGYAVQWLAPMVGVPVGEPGAYALVGMGTLFAGIIRAPLTSVFMIFEITQDYQIFVPLMVANMISLFISRRYQKVSIYEALLAQDGVHLPGPLVRQSVGGWRAGDVMRTDVDSWFVAPSTPVGEALAAAETAGTTCLLTGRRDAVDGLVARDVLVRAIAEGRTADPVAALAADDWAHVHADHAIDVVLERFSRNQSGLLLVLSRANVRQVEGVITQETLLGVFGAKRMSRETRP